LARAAGTAAAEDDAFFEFTADDFANVARAQQRRAAADSVLMTRTAREAQARARAAALPPIPVRLHFPDGGIVQAEFKSTQPVSTIAALARALVDPQLAPALYLYTAPPKQVLKDPAATLFDLKLYPAAHVYVGLDAGKAPAGAAAGWLRAEVAALMTDTVPSALGGKADEAGSSGNGAAAQGDEAAAARDRDRVLAEARRRAAASGSAAGGGDGEKKVPKCESFVREDGRWVVVAGAAACLSALSRLFDTNPTPPFSFLLLHYTDRAQAVTHHTTDLLRHQRLFELLACCNPKLLCS